MPNVLDNNIIVAAVADPKTHTVTVTWANGEKTVNSFRHLIGKGVFAAFSDPAFFARVGVGIADAALHGQASLSHITTAILNDTGAVISAKPFPAGAYREPSPLMHEIRADGLDL